MATHSSILVCWIPWTEEHCGLQSIGSQRVRHCWSIQHAHMHYMNRRRIVQVTPTQSLKCDWSCHHSGCLHGQPCISDCFYSYWGCQCSLESFEVAQNQPQPSQWTEWERTAHMVVFWFNYQFSSSMLFTQGLRVPRELPWWLRW